MDIQRSIAAPCRHGGGTTLECRPFGPPCPPVPESPELPLIADIAVDCPGRDHYSWLVPEDLPVAPGDCVTVPFGRQTLRGFALSVERRAAPTTFTLKPVLGRQEGVRLPPHLLRLIAWGARYYRCSLGEFLAGAVPKPVREGAKPDIRIRYARIDGFAGKLTARQRQVYEAMSPVPTLRTELHEATGASESVFDKLVDLGAAQRIETEDIQEIRLGAKVERHPLTNEQTVAVEAVAKALDAGRHETFLLYGVTGSGKTLVYLELAERVIAAGKQVLLLLPEIGLTPQLAARVRTRLPRTEVMHSGFTDGERAAAWARIAAGLVDLVVGTRSALFAPLPAPGLLIVDEEHDPSYKQESTPRYHARDLAVVYAGHLGVPVILGSATPSLETVHNARPQDGKPARYTVLSLKNRPAGGKLPTPVLVDMRDECKAQKRAAVLSTVLVDHLVKAKAAGSQAIILLNRRGWAPILSCGECGQAVMCTSCDIALTWHKAEGILKCHYCGARRPRPQDCPVCTADALGTTGIGTEQLAAAIPEAVPGMTVLRVDADTVAGRQGHARLFQQFAEGAADCLVGTQMVAKGLNFPKVTVVGVLCADKGLAVPDFRAGERTWQLIAQVAGRAGRADRPGTVVVQAYDIDAPAIRCALENRPKTFVDAELKQRQEYGYPPYTGLIRILWTGESQANVQLVAQDHAQRLEAARHGAVVLGPTPASLAFGKDLHRWHALIKCASRGAAQALLDRLAAEGGLPEKKGVTVTIDVDPQVTG